MLPVSTWTWKGLGHLENFACMYIEDAGTLGEKEESQAVMGEGTLLDKHTATRTTLSTGNHAIYTPQSAQ